MKKQFLAIGIIAVLVCVGLSGCNQISNVFLSDKNRLVGAWNTEGIWLDVPTVLVFSSNNTFSLEIKLGDIEYSLSDGEWEMKDGILTLEMADVISTTSYTYQFSDDNKTLTITDINTSESYTLRKQ